MSDVDVEHVEEGGEEAEEEEVEDEFHSVMNNAKDLFTLLKCLYNRDKSQLCSIAVCSSGCRVTADHQSVAQANIYIKQLDFEEFKLLPDNGVTIRINLYAFMLAVEGSTMAQVIFSYRGEGSRFVIIVRDENSLVTTKIRVYRPVNIMNFDFAMDTVFATVVMTPQTLKEVIRDIDTHHNGVWIRITPNDLTITSLCETLKITSTFPTTSVEVESINCSEDVIEFCYRPMLIKRVLTSVTSSTRLALRIKGPGIMNIQFMIPQTNRPCAYLDYFCIADAEEQDFNNDKSPGSLFSR